MSWKCKTDDILIFSVSGAIMAKPSESLFWSFFYRDPVFLEDLSHHPVPNRETFFSKFFPDGIHVPVSAEAKFNGPGYKLLTHYVISFRPGLYWEKTNRANLFQNAPGIIIGLLGSKTKDLAHILYGQISKLGNLNPTTSLNLKTIIP